MTQLKDIEGLARAYADAYAELGDDVAVLENSIREIRRKMLPRIKRAADKAAQAKQSLTAAVESAPALFVKPRTRLLHGIKVGFAKQKGTVELGDEAAVIRRIRKLLPEDQAELLIRTQESVHKQAVYDLSVEDLKRLGISITNDSDRVVVKVADSDIEKLVDALLKDEEAGRVAA